MPVVICDGSGGAADLLAFAHQVTGENQWVRYFKTTYIVASLIFL